MFVCLSGSLLFGPAAGERRVLSSFQGWNREFSGALTLFICWLCWLCCSLLPLSWSLVLQVECWWNKLLVSWSHLFNFDQIDICLQHAYQLYDGNCKWILNLLLLFRKLTPSNNLAWLSWFVFLSGIGFIRCTVFCLLGTTR